MKRLITFDFDGCLMNSKSPEDGKPMWEKYYGQQFPFAGWWGRKESLDTNVFDIKPFPNILDRLNQEMGVSDTKVIILTARMEKLRPDVEKVLNINNIVVDEVILKQGNEDKGDIILKIQKYNPDLKEIVVYDDFANRNPVKIAEYTKIRELFPSDIQYIIYYVDNDKISLLESNNKLTNIVNEEIKNFIAEDDYVYHGTYDGAAFSI